MSADGSARRFSSRVPVFVPASLANAEERVDCTVLNMSPTGAKLQIDAVIDTSDKVTLTVHRLGTLAGDIIWRRGNMMGLAFDSASEDVADFLKSMAADPPDDG